INEYRIYETAGDVPQEIFADERMVIEKFVAEPDPEGFGVRFWVFCGESERCNGYVSRDRLVKGKNVIRREPVPVPDELRVLRSDLGFDYGKFDFVIHEGRPILLDANRTPGSPPAIVDIGERVFADGFEKLISQRLPV